MYESFFSMTATPFVRNIPVDMLYLDRMTDEIHDRLLYAAQHQWFGLLVGDSGGGKTTTIRRLASSLDENRYSVLYLADS